MFLDKITYSAKDIRYTRKGTTIYAIVLGWPGDAAQVTLESFTGRTLDKVPAIKSVSVLGSAETIKYTLDESGLHFTTPKQKPDDKAFVLKIETK